MKISIIGAGSFGTAIAQTVSYCDSDIFLFGRNDEALKSINKYHINPRYHPLATLNTNIKALDLTRDPHLLQESDLIIFSIPSGATREVARTISDYLHGKTIVSAAKGIDCPSLRTMSQVITDETSDVMVSSFSGATFADELIQGAFSCATLGINADTNKKMILDAFSAPNLSLDISNDVEGVEMCGVLKNVYAIAVGIFDSVVTGDNQHYGFLSLCFKEMAHILHKASSDPYLSYKFCAHGDLHLTANVDKSRNRILGFLIGKLGVAPQEVQSKIVVEGVKSARALKKRTEQLGVDTPIISFVNACLDSPTRAREYVANLLEALPHTSKC